VSTFDIVQQHGPWRLAAFLAAVALFLVLHLIRLPFVWIERGLAAVQRGLDARITTAMTPPTARPFHTAPCGA